MHLQSARGSCALIATASLAAAGNIIYNDSVCDLTNYTTSSPWWDFFIVETQAAFDATLGNCTTIIGSVYISPNYTGSFVMNNVTNMTHEISTYGELEQDATSSTWIATDPSPLLTSLQADSLVFLGGLGIWGVPGLDSISMAKLEFVSSLTVYSNPTMSLNFPRLKNSTDIQIQGGYSSLNIDQLVNVGQSLLIWTTNGTVLLDTYLQSSPIDINFPSLINTTYMTLWGNISSLYMPNLTTAIPPESFGNTPETGISIQNSAQQPFNVSLPKLWNSTRLFVAGSLGSVSLSSFSTSFGGYPFNNSFILAENFNPLLAGGEIDINGNIASINISNFQSIGRLSVWSEGPFDCNSLGADYAKIKNSTQTGTDQLKALGFDCHEIPKPKPKLSTGGKIGIGIAVSITGLGLIIWFMIWKHKRDAEKEANRLPGYNLAILDPVPKYPHVTTIEGEAEGGENGSPATSARSEA